MRAASDEMQVVRQGSHAAYMDARPKMGGLRVASPLGSESHPGLKMLVWCIV